MKTLLFSLKFFRLVVLNIILGLIWDGEAYQVGNNPFRRGEYLDPARKYLLEWQVDWDKEQVNFNISVETNGWVGFGLGNDGSSADFIVGGVRKDVTAYFSDRHVIRGSLIHSVLDKSQDWTLNSAWEDGKRTFLSVTRAFDTCDDEDYGITINRITLIWAYGTTDDKSGFVPSRHGTFQTHLLDPDYSPEVRRDRSGAPKLITSNRNENIPTNTKVWRIPKHEKLPRNETIYYCGVYKAPQVSRKHHLIGFDALFENDISFEATHHMLLFKCTAPSGYTDAELFGPYLTEPDQICYLPRPNDPFFLRFCDRLHMQHAFAGNTFFFPNHVGMPFGSTPEKDDFYLIQLHYNNPNELSNIQVDLSLDFFYTDRLRPNEGGMIILEHDVPGLPESLLLPPNSFDHRTFAHCSGECTKRMFPKEGISVFAIGFHNHNAGVGMRLRHFRGKQELPWFLYDDNWSPGFQEKRHLKNEVRVLQGDRISLDCHYRTNESTVVGGFSTRQEMCAVIIMYYNSIEDFTFCQSSLNAEGERLKFLGITNVSWIEQELEWVVNDPPHYNGWKLTEVSDKFVHWSPESRKQFQRFHELGNYWAGCHKNGHVRNANSWNGFGLPLGVPPAQRIDTEFDYRAQVTYPFGAIPYAPPQSKCNAKAKFA